MPKDHTNERRIHEPSVKLIKRQFTVQGDARHVKIGSAVEPSSPEVLESCATEEPLDTLTKKGKQQAKKEAFLQRLESSVPYSRSHHRRLRRKAKEQIVGGNLDDLQMAIAALDDRAPDEHDSESGDDNTVTRTPSAYNPRPRLKPAKIGEGKKNPLSISQRKHALVLEQIRQPLILSNPEFSLNPFQTLRTHARNTLSKHPLSI